MRNVSRTLWSERRMPIPRALSRVRIFWSSTIVRGSMPVKGSSRSRNFGSRVRARQISSRRRSPPDRLWAGWPASGEQSEFLEQGRGGPGPARCGSGRSSRASRRLSADRGLEEDRVFLGQVGQPGPGPLVRRGAGDVPAVEEDRARGRAGPGRRSSGRWSSCRRRCGRAGR